MAALRSSGPVALATTLRRSCPTAAWAAVLRRPAPWRRFYGYLVPNLAQLYGGYTLDLEKVFNSPKWTIGLAEFYDRPRQRPIYSIE